MTLEPTAPGRTCPQCGAVIAATAAEGLCPRCLFGQIGQETPASQAPSAEQGTDADWAAGERGEVGDYELTQAPGQTGGSRVSDAFSPDGNTLISGGDVLHIWTAPTWEEIDAAEAGYPGTEPEP